MKNSVKQIHRKAVKKKLRDKRIRIQKDAAKLKRKEALAKEEKKLKKARSGEPVENVVINIPTERKSNKGVKYLVWKKAVISRKQYEQLLKEKQAFKKEKDEVK